MYTIRGLWLCDRGQLLCGEIKISIKSSLYLCTVYKHMMISEVNFFVFLKVLFFALLLLYET